MKADDNAITCYILVNGIRGNLEFSIGIYPSISVYFFEEQMEMVSLKISLTKMYAD